MKKLIALVLVGLMISAGALAEKRFDLEYGDFFDLEPGVYEVGKDFQSGKYDIRFIGLNKEVIISYSFELNEDGFPDLENDYSFSFTFDSASNWWNIGGFVVTLFPGYIQIENSGCRMWVER